MPDKQQNSTAMTATLKRVQKARDRITAIRAKGDLLRADQAKAMEALQALGAEPQPTSFEDAESWQRSVFEWRFSHSRASAAVELSYQAQTELDEAGVIAAAETEIAAADTEQAALLAQHFGEKANALAKELAATIVKFDAARFAGDPKNLAAIGNSPFAVLGSCRR